MKRIFLTAAITLFLVTFFGGLKPLCAAPDKTYNLKFSVFLPPTHAIVRNVYEPWIKEIQEKTGGKVKITLYSGGTLGTPKDQYDLVVRGIADLTVHVTGYTPGRFPLTDVMSLPILVPSAKDGASVVWQIYEKYLTKEYADAKVLMVSTHDPGQMHMGKVLNSLADIKGKRIRNGFPVQMPVLKAWGASPLAISVADTYDAMQKGMADGTWTGPSALKDFKLMEVTKSHILVNSTCPVSVIVMNMKTWKSLPPDVQKVFDELSGLKLSVRQAAEFDRTSRKAMDEAKSLGHKLYELTPAEKKAWKEKAQPVCDAWVADMEKKGLPGKKVYQEAITLLDKHSK